MIKLLFASFIYLLLGAFTFRSLDTRVFSWEEESTGSLIARIFWALLWPVIWTLALLAKITNTILR